MKRGYIRDPVWLVLLSRLLHVLQATSPVDKESQPQQHTWNSEFFVLFPLKITAALSLHFQHLNED